MSLRIRFKNIEEREDFKARFSDEGRECFLETSPQNMKWSYGLPSQTYNTDLVCPCLVFNNSKELLERVHEFMKNNYSEYTKKGNSFRTHKVQKQDIEFVYPQAENKYPIFVISKGRYNLKKSTFMIFERLKLKYYIVVEQDEYEDYKSVVSIGTILILPDEYRNTGCGSVPARNYCWDYAVELGFDKHWVLDDNIRTFYRWNYTEKFKFESGLFFKIMEDFMDNCRNVGLLGPNYSFDVRSCHTGKTSHTFNSKVYSCILINTKILSKHRIKWRGTYNEDVDLSLRTLYSGISTVQFNMFLQDKPTTMSVNGGNTDSIYSIDKETYLKNMTRKVNSLIIQNMDLFDKYPDIITVVKKNTSAMKVVRDHHKVKWNYFRNINPELIIDDDYVNDYDTSFTKKN